MFKFSKTAFIISSLISSAVFAENKAILFVGQSGVGKTTTINAVYNAAMNKNTPVHNKDSLQFIIPIKKGSFDQIPLKNSRAITSVYEEDKYGGVDTRASTKKGRSDTRKITGYRFTPKCSGWNPRDTLEIIDTPGIDDTAKTKCDNNSIHLQIIRKIEEYLRQYGHQTYAIFVVVSNDISRADDEEQDPVARTFAALREALPPEIRERIFIVTNRVPDGDDINDDLKDIINENFTWHKGSVVIPYNNYISENPTYIAKFNKLLQGTAPSRFLQNQRSHTEDNLRNTLECINDFNTSLPLQGYPHYLEYKHEIAKNVYEVAKYQVEVDNAQIKCQQYKEEFERRAKDYNRLRGRQDGDAADIRDGIIAGTGVGGAAAGAAASAGLIPLAATPAGWVVGAFAALGGLISFFSGHDGIDDPVLRQQAQDAHKKLLEAQNTLKQFQRSYETYLSHAKRAFSQMQSSQYRRYVNFSKTQFASEIRSRVQTHFPDLYQNSLKTHLTDAHINNICAQITKG